MNNKETLQFEKMENTFSIDDTTDSFDSIVSSTTIESTETLSPDIEDLERYLSDILNGLQKKQETQNNEVIQLILKQHQELQGNGSENLLYDQLPTLNNKSIPHSGAWTFTQGLILGQLSVIILIVAFIKFFIFTEATPTQASLIPTKSNISIIKTATKNNDEIDSMSNDDMNHEKEINQALESGNIRLDSNKKLTSILEKTYYDVKIHKAESLDWFNVLVAQIISQGRLEALNDGNIYESLNKALNSPQVLQFFDRIKITEINIGDDYPIFSNCRVKNNEGRLEAKIDVDVSDTITLGVETNLLINQPKFMSASLPIKLSISVVRFSACLSVSLITVDNDKVESENDMSKSEGFNKTNVNQTNSQLNRESNDFTDNNQNDEHLNTNDSDSSNGNGGHSIALMFSFSPDFRLEFETKSLIGSRAKLENIPRVSSILENVIRKWFIERCIEPRFQLIKLPSMWPRKKNTRESVPSE
ncbi:ERMES complex subunit mmm1 [Pichia californica]|uniref:Maintenance of mitochondrial morphology protein 1 n=1 Tax=Pichia californica TaxID=460514 RepID=A0A9P6WHN5_9ASCO|nr:ERMES complex subunit mmm1 [[Candida] californica]KAG0686939.1 ERMES complex subunit mmm1 [[Candida] californica]